MAFKIIAVREVPSQEVLSIVGGKGGNLLRLTEAGADVPPFIVLASPCFDAFIASFQAEFDRAVDALDCTSPQTIARTAGALRELICRQPLPADLAADLFGRLAAAAPGAEFFAVRSSALGEDSKEFSYAGMLDTYLFNRTREEIAAAVIKCWSSIYSDRAVAYRHMRHIGQKGISMAVVVQKMIDGAASGVTFTVNPTTKYQDEILITSVYGLGEGLVSGALNSDQFVCLKQADYPIVARELAEKEDRIVFDRARGAGTIEEKVPEDERQKPSLTDEQVKKIAAVCHKIEQSYGHVPQDIEWTVDRDGSVRILQARPITTIDQPWPSERRFLTLWDNSNIVESYSGVTTPLTFSFALHAYHSVYVQFCEVLKVPQADILANDFAFANMLGLLNGRIYYNLKNWYRLISVLPGYKWNSRFMEGMMGVKAKFEEEVKTKPASWFDRWFVELPKLAWSGINLAWKFWNTDSEVKTFMTIYQNMYNKYKDFDFNRAPAHQIVGIYNELEITVLKNWKAPIVNDFMAMIFYGILRALIGNWNLDREGGPLANDLCAGQGNVESTLPMRALQKMARFIHGQPGLLEIFQKNDPARLKAMFAREALSTEPAEHQEMCKKVHDYLAEYGYRAMNELKLEEPSLNEKPEFLFSMLKNYLGGKLPPEDDTGEAEAKKREAAEARVKQALAGQKLYGIPKIDILMFVAGYAKKAMAVREYQRFARTKMYGLVRRMFLGIGHRFTERGLLDRPDDIFYLTTTEVIGYTVGTATSQKLRELAAVRKAEFETYRQMEELPDRIETHGIVYTNDLSRGAIQQALPDDPNLLKGIGGCSGVVRGKVKVILSPSDDMSLNGEILVAARTDPGWVPLFASASALLIERGSMLSHSVIVARELGLPAVVGVTGATKRLKTGDLVELDGTTGLIKILERA
ncbi:MAG: phosphoenolpyruvate synthase [Candidatus Riflebacteria bacterium]|nr:phosphoenolpyruvate synthase [Candidatus Riflebacteria bacterium]